MRIRFKQLLGCIVVLGIVLFASEGHSLQPIPDRATGYVNDYAGLLNNPDRKAVESLAAELERKTSAQLAVVTVESTSPETIEMYAERLFRTWGIGQQSKDNGVLLLVAYKDRNVRIETGYGLEGAVTDAYSKRIIERYIIPQFKSGNFSNGIRQGAFAIVSLAASEYGVNVTGQESNVYKAVRQRPSTTQRFLKFIFTLFAVMIILSSRSGLFGWFLFGSMMGGHRRGGYWYGSDFGGSSGGFSGGFGGFGGGMSGGGGASGSW